MRRQSYINGTAAAKATYLVNGGWNTRIDFTTGDNPKVKDVKVDETLDDSIVKELDESGFVKSLGLK